MVRQTKALAVRLWKDERGASLLEYSVLVGLITAAVVVTITAVSVWTGGRWTTLLSTLTGSPS
ncbi:MAG: Flp family type IVb pilin [Rhodospirillales bacterium]|nr:Flp family type IVb pilin [Rhodospirillales bacterium]